MILRRAYLRGPDGCMTPVPLDHPVRAGEKFIVRTEERFQVRVCSSCGAFETLDEFT